MPRQGAILDVRRPCADQDLRRNEPFPATVGTRARNAERTSRTQVRRQLATQRAAALDIQRLVDRLVADAHGEIVRKVER